MCILTFLQQNAEWMCAIAIVYFAWKQYAITKLQIQQDLRTQRLELAQQLDEACKNFPLNKEEANVLVEWCLSHSSKFMFLLNEKDATCFTKFIDFLWDIRMKYTNNIPFNQIETTKVFMTFLSTIDMLLGNAKYGLTEVKQKELNK